MDKIKSSVACYEINLKENSLQVIKECNCITIQESTNPNKKRMCFFCALKDDDSQKDFPHYKDELCTDERNKHYPQIKFNI